MHHNNGNNVSFIRVSKMGLLWEIWNMELDSHISRIIASQSTYDPVFPDFNFGSGEGSIHQTL